MSIILERELERLKRRILGLGAMVEENLHLAFDSVRLNDPDLAAKVHQRELEVDEREVEIEEECLKLLALHQPVAMDLRFIVAVLKINSDLERIGDLALNVAECTESLAGEQAIPLPSNLEQMYDTTTWMVRHCLESLVNLDTRLARKVLAADEIVDSIHAKMYDDIRAAIRRHLEQIIPLTHYLTVSRFLERIADHATNIAEDVIYMVDGEIIRHKTESTGADESNR